MELRMRAELTALRVLVESLITTLPRTEIQRVAQAFEEHAMLVEGLRLNSPLPDEAVQAQQTAMDFWRDVLRSMDTADSAAQPPLPGP